jgi:RND superfamily putative drug exporter
LLVATGLAMPSTTDAGRQAWREIVAPLLNSSAVVAVVSPGSALDTLLVGVDPTTAIAIVGLRRDVTGALDSVRAVTKTHLPALRTSHPSLQLRWTGQAALTADLRAHGAQETRRTELRALPVTLLVAAIAFGSLSRAGIALVAAALTIVIALGATGLLTHWIPATPFTRTLVSMVGLALTIDYVLALQRGLAGRTVALAAGMVAIGFLGVAIAPTAELRSAAAAGVVTALVAALVSLAIARAQPSVSSAAAAPISSPALTAWSRQVVAHPWLVLALTLGPLLFLANAARTARIATPLDALLPVGMESADAYHALRNSGRDAVTTSLRVLVELPPGVRVLTDTGWRAMQQATATFEAVPGVADARSITTIGTRALGVARDVLPRFVQDAWISRDGRTAIIDVFPEAEHAGPRVAAFVRAVRAVEADVATGLPNSRVVASGLPAYALDYESAMRGALPWIVVAVAAATFVAMLAAYRAPVVALKAVALNALVAAAATGATALWFRDSIFPTVPALAFGAAFGISMDYEVFLLSGVRDARYSGLTPADAIVTGIARTGGLITRAAAVMVCLFLAFSTSNLLPLAMVGFTLAVAVALDATLVRLALAPALLRIAGRWNWWPARPISPETR